ncbi:MAG TPA: acetylxylan esterase [Candidatus Limnocylindria bacterium]|nr:acetylxylan esterase [Candidatus Limnocylindria bacterium]
MKTFARILCVATGFLVVVPASAAEISFPEKDQRAVVKTLNTPRAFPEITSKTEWERRAQAIREQVLVSCGLWPMPEKTPLNAKIFGRIERDGYSVEKVYFQSYPGFYVGGNLYRPLGKGKGPFAAILNPHGHWNKGRLEDVAAGSSAARCINFARQGMIAFAWDMIGYNDTQFARPVGGDSGYKTHRHFANDLTNQLWNISQMGLQTWNSVRALDFLESLPDVDSKRMACTGESGGGTQTFMLGAIDDRMVVQAPIVMVSHSMQGGCSCENVAGLRVDYSNMEIAAAAAPRSQILVGATGDWTRATMEIEGPALERIYNLFGQRDHLRYVRFDFDHNYNKTSREAVYEWFGQWLLHAPEPSALKEVAYIKEPDVDLRVFPDGKLPSDAVTEEQLTEHLIRSATNVLWTYAPINPPLLERYRQQMIPAWKRSLQVEFVERGLMVAPGKITKTEDYTATKLTLGRAGKGDRIPVTLITPRRDTLRIMAVLAHPDGRAGFLDAAGAPKGLARQLLDKNIAVLLVDTFHTGESAQGAGDKKRDYAKDFFPTYNRTDAQERVQDLVTACAFAQTHGKGRRVVLCGFGRAGLWAALAAPACDALVADCAQFDSTSDSSFLADDIFAPGLRKLGGFEGVAAMNTGNPLLLHNVGGRFTTNFISHVYTKMRVPEMYRQETSALTDAQLATWISDLKVR